MFDSFSKKVDEFGNGILDVLNQFQGFFGKELNVATPIKSSILEMLGNTPLIRLNHVASHIQGIDFFIKAEFQNPTGSLRDRSAIAMIQDGIKRGKLTKKTTILIHDATTSSISMAWAGRTMGFKVKCLVPESTSQELLRKLSHYGAVVFKTTDDPVQVVHRESKNSEYWYPNENFNMANPNHHFAKTGPEIHRDLKGKVDHLVTGGGTGGTVTGIGRFFRSHSTPLSTKIILAGWKDSTFDRYFSNKEGDKNLPEIFDPKVVDRFIPIAMEEARRYQSDLMVREGIPVGITTGMVLCAAIRYAESLPNLNLPKNQNEQNEKENLVILCPDRE